MMTVKQRNKKYKSIINIKTDFHKIEKKQQIILRIIIIIATIISLNGFSISANSQENSGSINKNSSATTSQTNKNIFLKDLKETSFLEQILIGIIPISMGMGSTAFFTFLKTFFNQNQYSINKNHQNITDSLEQRTRNKLINKLRNLLDDPIFVKGGTILAVIAAFGAFALTMRQKEFDRFSRVKPVFEIEQLENKKFKLFNHNGGIVFFIGCNQKYIEDTQYTGEDYLNNVLFKESKKLKTTPKQYSSLSKTNSLEFIFEEEIEQNNYFICYYRDVDLNLYELKIVYKKNPDTNTNSKSFYIDGVPLVYRSELFVTMSWKFLDTIVSIIFPKDWYQKDERLKIHFQKCAAYKKEKYKLDTIDKCLTVKYSNSDG